MEGGKKRLTINVDQVRIYRHRKCDETEIGTGSSDNGSLRDESSGFYRVQRRSNESQDGKNKGSEKEKTKRRNSNAHHRRLQPQTTKWKRVESRPTIESKDTTGGPFRSRKRQRKERQPPTSKSEQDQPTVMPDEGGDQQRQDQERKGGWITEGRVYRRGGSGRPRNTNDREDRAIRRVATSAPTTSLASIQRHLPPSRHPVPSRETIRRRLTEVGLRSRRPLRRLPLTPHHRQCRLDFCRPRATWSVTDWIRVIFSDESRDSVSVLMTTAHVSGGAPASGPIRHLLSSGIQQFHKV
ncbi:HTH_Tnp_Tc3_2 domain-containing protein [Trichonephila clavipes]|nr:HTH_Tnp_Tc3_2 domain-containing protein [Trichonephila clavipes]